MAVLVYHVSASSNRGSIERHGLDWRRMEGRGIAGSLEPEREGIFLAESLEEADFFCWMGRPSGVL